MIFRVTLSRSIQLDEADVLAHKRPEHENLEAAAESLAREKLRLKSPDSTARVEMIADKFKDVPF